MPRVDGVQTGIMRRLFLFFFLSAFLELLVLCVAYKTASYGDAPLVIAAAAFFGLLMAFAATLVAVIILRISGRMSAFTASASGVGGTVALSELLIGYLPGALLRDAAVWLVGYFVAIQIAWHLPLVRRLVLSVPEGRPARSICGTFAFVKDQNRSL